MLITFAVTRPVSLRKFLSHYKSFITNLNKKENIYMQVQMIARNI